jgi:hypothetical protein
MNKLNITTPDIRPDISSKVPLDNSLLLPLEKIGDEHFEWLTYWLYHEEIKFGSFKGIYDKIRLMNATGDKARDCVLYKGNLLTGVIQCKHSKVLTKLAQGDFLKEVIKFVLYSIVYPDEIKIFQGFNYYIASSAGFADKCQSLIDDFQSSINGHPKLQHYFQAVVDKYANLRHLSFVDQEQELQKRLLMLEVDMITDHDISRIANEDYQSVTKNIFFSYQMVVDKQLLGPIEAQLGEMNNMLVSLARANQGEIIQPVARPKPIADVEGYFIPRNLFKSGDELMAQFSEKKTGLLDLMEKERYIALLGWGLSGKSHELRHAAAKLSLAVNEFHVFLVKLDTFAGEPLEAYIADFERRPQENIVLFLDGFDEIIPEHYAKSIIAVNKFVEGYPDVRIVVSSRNNSYSSLSENGDSTLSGFTTVKMLPLTSDDINAYLKGLGKFNIIKFWKKVNLNQLSELLSTPYYLVEFARKFKATGEIFKSKGDLFQETIKKAIAKDVGKLLLKNPEASEISMLKGLEKLAFVLECQGKNYFYKNELLAVFPDNPQRELILQAGSLLNGNDEDEGHWTFFHHNIQEYLCASVLARNDFNVIRELITFGEGVPIIKTTWVHTISFLIDFFDDALQKKQQVIDLVMKCDPGLFMKFEPDKLNDKFKFDIFSQIYIEHKKALKRFNRSRFQLGEIGRFCQSKMSLEFLISEIEHEQNEIVLLNAIEVLSSFELHKFPFLKAKLKEVLKLHLEVENYYLRFLVAKILIDNYKLDYSEFDKLIGEFRNDAESYPRVAFFHGIITQKLQEDYRVYLTAQISFLAQEDWRSIGQSGGALRLSDEYYQAMSILRLFETKESALLMLGEILRHYSAFRHSIYFRDAIAVVLELAQRLLPDKEIIKMVDKVFMERALKGEENGKQNNWTDYYLRTGQNLRIAKLILKKFPLNDFKTLLPVIHLASEQVLSYVAQRFREGKIDIARADYFQYQLGQSDPHLLSYFNLQVNKTLLLQMPVTRDFTEINQREGRLKLKVLFDLKFYLSEIRRMFRKAGKKSLKFEDIHTLGDEYTRYGYGLFGLFEDRRGTRDNQLSQVLIKETGAWERRKMSRIYHAVNRKEVELGPDHIAMVREWCRALLPFLDFKAVVADYDDVALNNPQIAVSFFARKFGFDDLGDDFYLNLLSIRRWDDHEVDIFPFVQSKCEFADVQERVLLNLETGGINGDVLESHLSFLSEHDMRGSVDLLLPYLESNATYKWPEVLRLYLAFGGELLPLTELLSKLDVYYHDVLVHVFIREQPAAIVDYLQGIFGSETNEGRKLEIAKMMIGLQLREGIAYYFDFIKKYGVSPDYSAAHNPLYRITSLANLDIALQIFEYAFDSGIEFDSISDLKSISALMLQGIALSDGNYPKFEMRLLSFVQNRKAARTAEQSKNDDLIHQLMYLNDGWKYQYCINLIPKVNEIEALDIWKKFE